MPNRAFVRFTNVTIPGYSDVSNVFARFTAYSTLSGTPINLRCAFVDADNPNAPASYTELQNYNVTNWVTWNALNSWTDGYEYDTPDLSDILQTVIEREGWQTNNALILIIENVGSGENRDFSSIQFSGGSEKAVLFATYLARETTFSGDDEFTGPDGSIPNANLWYLPSVDLSWSELPVIQNNQLYGATTGIIDGYVRMVSSWYAYAPFDVQVDWDGRNLATNGISYMYFGVTHANNTDIGSLSPPNLGYWTYRASSDEMYAWSTGFLESTRWTGLDHGTWRISVNVQGISYRIRYYFNGTLYHTETADGLAGYPYLGVIFQVWYNPQTYPIQPNYGTFDNFVVNTGTTYLLTEGV